MCFDGSDAKTRTILSYIAVRDRLRRFRTPGREPLAGTGRMNQDVIPSSRDNLDSSADVSGCVSMDMMPRPARCNAELVCGADFVTKSTLFAPSVVYLVCTGRRYCDMVPSCPGGLDSSADVS